MTSRFLVLTLSLVAVVAVSACSSAPKGEAQYPTGMDRNTKVDQNDIYSDTPSIFGDGGISLLGKKKADTTGADGVTVNSYLWRAALDTVSFMPLASADPFGGVILTDWYTPPETPGERIKLNVFILDRQLRSDGIQVKVFRQVRKGNDWRDADASIETGRQVEDAILTRARQMRVEQLAKD
jgi:hypothetical protein